MRELRIGLTSDGSDDIDPSTVLGIGLQAFGMAIATPYPGTQSNFVTVFPKLTRVRWTRGSCEPWDYHEPGGLARFHLCCQPYLLRSMHAMRTLESIEVSFEDNLVISNCQTEYFETSVAHLTSVDLSGEIGQLFQCIAALPSSIALKTLRLTTWEYWDMDDFLQLLINLQRVIQAATDSCRLVTLEITNYLANEYSPIIYNPISVSPGLYNPVMGPLASVIGPTLSTLRLDPLIDMEFPPDFLNTFLAAKNLRYLSVGSNAARLVHPTSLITLKSIVAFIDALPYLEDLFIPWTIEFTREETPEGNAGPESPGSSPEAINLNFKTLGYPYVYDLDAEAIVSILEVIDSILPSLTQLHIFSCYIDDWNDSLYHTDRVLGFSLQSFQVVYQDDVHSDM
jgi:hypothetical protein